MTGEKMRVSTSDESVDQPDTEVTQVKSLSHNTEIPGNAENPCK